MSRDPHRGRRVEGQIQRSLSELLRRELRDPRASSITITAVRVSPDLRHAKVFYVPFLPGQDPEALREALADAARHLRGALGRQLKLRLAPELVFLPDEQLAESVRLDALIDAAVADDEQRHQRSGDAAEDPDGADEDAGR